MPAFPGVLIIDVTATKIEAVHAKEKHHEAMCVYRECNNVKKSLLRHAQNAIESKYMEHLINEDTDLIKDDLPLVLQCLFTSYEKVPLEEVKQRESEVLSILFNPADPMVIIYCPIEQLATTTGIPYLVQQQLDICLTLIRGTRDFVKTLGEWNSKTSGDKT